MNQGRWIRVIQYGVSGVGGVLNRAFGQIEAVAKRGHRSRHIELPALQDVQQFATGPARSA